MLSRVMRQGSIEEEWPSQARIPVSASRPLKASEIPVVLCEHARAHMHTRCVVKKLKLNGIHRWVPPGVEPAAYVYPTQGLSLAVKSTRSSSGGPGFNCQHPHRGSKLSVNLISGDPMSSSGLHGHQACMQCTNIDADKTLTHRSKVSSN